MKPRNLIVASVVLVALAGAVWWAQKHPSTGTTSPSTPAATKLADIQPSQMQAVTIAKRGGATIALDRENGKWVITAPEHYAADQDAVSSMLSAVNPLNSDTDVTGKAADLTPYGLNNPSLTVDLRQTNGKTSRLDIGSDVPAGSLVYAKLASSPKVYAVTNSVKSSFDKSLNDLRDKRLLTFDTNKLTRVELTSTKGDLEFGKNNQGDWQILKPEPYRADSFQVEELVRKLSDAKMDLSSNPGDQKKADAAFASGQRVTTVKVSDASGTQTLDVRKNKDDYYASSSAVPGDYKVSTDLGQAVSKSADDFRNKKLFDFGFTDPNKIDVQQGGTDKTYVRAGSDWKLGGKIMDPGTIQSFIDELRDLSAAKFATGAFAGPMLTIVVQSNDYKRTENVEFAKTGDGYTAKRENEQTLYQLDAKSVDDILEALKAIKPAASGKNK